MREYAPPCRGCGKRGPSMFDIELLCEPCFYAFRYWVSCVLPDWNVLRVKTNHAIFDFSKPETNVMFDQWLEKGKPGKEGISI